MRQTKLLSRQPNNCRHEFAYIVLRAVEMGRVTFSVAPKRVRIALKTITVRTNSPVAKSISGCSPRWSFEQGSLRFGSSFVLRELPSGRKDIAILYDDNGDRSITSRRVIAAALCLMATVFYGGNRNSLSLSLQFIVARGC